LHPPIAQVGEYECNRVKTELEHNFEIKGAKKVLATGRKYGVEKCLIVSKSSIERVPVTVDEL